MMNNAWNLDGSRVDKTAWRKDMGNKQRNTITGAKESRGGS